MAEETTKIVRMQQRRGQKQDLPKPLRPGEIGFATDSRQIYIGADTTDAISDIYNKTGNFEKTASAQSTTTSIANVQVIKFTVPHKIYDKGEFDGVTDSISWTHDSLAASSSTATQYARLYNVFRPTDTRANNIITNVDFASVDLKVVKNGTTLVPSSVGAIGSGKDYFFSQSGETNTLTFRTAPSGSEEIAVSYYSNVAIINAIEKTTIGTSAVEGFYTNKNISFYRQLTNDNIRVADGIGVGFIGMQFKHIQVATDIKHTPLPATYTSTLGTLFLTKNDTAVASVASVYDAADVANVTLTGAIPTGTYSVAGTYNHVYAKGGTDWLQDGKVLAVAEYDSANAVVTATLPNNVASITRTISSVSQGAGAFLEFVAQNTQDVVPGDSVYFVDDVSNLSNLNGISSVVQSVTGSVIKTSVSIADYNPGDDANVELLTFMTHKGGVSTTVVVHSPRHGNGIGAGNSVILTGTGTGSINGTLTTTANVTGNVDTFIITTSGANTSNVDVLHVRPVVANATVSATPVVSIDLSSASSSGAVQTAVSAANTWVKISSIPQNPNTADISDELYVTHAEAVVKTPFTFALHEDAAGTVSALGLKSDEYSRTDSTIKAKLEDWMNSITVDPTVNLFKDVYVNTEFNSTFANDGTGHFNTWDLNLNSSIGEMNFEGRTEARDFTKILNNLFFETVNPDIRGLMNIKTNIEFLTSEALAAGTATTSFTSPESLAITAASGPQQVSELNLALDGDYQTAFVEYSMKATTGSGNYRRAGTLVYSGDTVIQDVVLTDTYSDSRSGTLTGNVEFSTAYNTDTATIFVDNTLSPSTSVSMKYIRRRWGD